MSPLKKIRVLVVDDSSLFRHVLTSKLPQNGQIEIVGYAVDAFDAQAKIPKLNPDVVTLDVEMPKMNGIDFLKKLMVEHPVAVVLVSSLNISVFDALSAGAVDFVQKPDMSVQSGVDTFISELSRKIVIASKAKVKTEAKEPASILGTDAALIESSKLDSIVIALGASTGGTEATFSVLKNLPANTPGMVVVQHMPPGFTKMYADRLNNNCPMEVKEAKSGDRIQRGRVLIAPGDMQMKVVKMGGYYTVNCFRGEKVSGHCPSVDVLFNSMAESVSGACSVGIIMTGMGRDGASGLLSMRKKGAFTIGQDKESCIVYGMPMVAYDIGAVTVQASCERIPEVLKRQLNKMAK